MNDSLTFEIPDYTITFNLVRDGQKTSHTLDVWEAYETLAKLYENVPDERKLIRDIIPQYQHFLKEKGFPQTSQSECTQIVKAVRSAFEDCKKKSEEGLKSPATTDSQATPSVNDSDE